MKRVEFIHSELGTHMWVAEDRVEEYKAAGHKLAAEAVKPAEAAPKKATKTRKK